MPLPQAVPRPRGARTPACRVGTLADARRAVTPSARCRICTRIPDGPNFSTGEMQTAARRIKAPSDSYRYGAITVRPWTARLTANKAERAYNLIMKDKEKLLSFETRLKFIFSHSALREGWDNPNVFQICAIREMGTEQARRQTIGRGLRLCVNQQGERLRGFDVNTLTVVATEGYEQFAANLPKEIEADTGIRFGVVEKHQFAPIPVTEAAGRTTALGV